MAFFLVSFGGGSTRNDRHTCLAIDEGLSQSQTTEARESKVGQFCAKGADSLATTGYRVELTDTQMIVQQEILTPESRDRNQPTRSTVA